MIAAPVPEDWVFQGLTGGSFQSLSSWPMASDLPFKRSESG